jgi:carboxylesterase
MSYDRKKMSLSPEPFLHEPSARHAVLLVHGLGGGPHEVQRLGEHLARVHGLSVQGLRLPGHGERRFTMPASSWPEWYGAVELAWRALTRRYETVQVVGFSTGGLLALRLAQEQQLTQKLVLLAPFLRVFSPRLLPVSPEALVRGLPFLTLVPRLGAPLRDPLLRAEVMRCAGYRTFNLEATRSALELIALVSPRLHEVQAPTLIFQGQKDTVVDPSGAEALVRQLPHAELVRLADSNHLVTLDLHAPEVLARAGAFLAGDQGLAATS